MQAPSSISASCMYAKPTVRVSSRTIPKRGVFTVEVVEEDHEILELRTRTHIGISRWIECPLTDKMFRLTAQYPILPRL